MSLDEIVSQHFFLSWDLIRRRWSKTLNLEKNKKGREQVPLDEEKMRITFAKSFYFVTTKLTECPNSVKEFVK